MSPGQASQLTSYLYGLKTPEAVQAYAAQHQNDINVIGIASGVANAMKRAQQQSAPQQPQPSVAQQTIAQMAPRAPMPQQAPQMAPQGQPMPQQAPQAQLPENNGIGQLPVPSMQSMAGGGITGEPKNVPGFAAGVYMGTTPGIEYSPAYGSPGAPNQGILPDRSGYEGMDLGDMLSAMGSDASNAIGNVVGQDRWNEFTRSRNASDKNYSYGNEGLRQPDAPAITNLPTAGASGAGQGTRGIPEAVVAGAGAGQGARGVNANLTPISSPAYDRAIAERNAANRGADASMAGLQGLLNNTGGDAFTRNLKAVQALHSQDPTAGKLQDTQYWNNQLMDAAKANGVDLENTKGFAELQKMDQRSQDLLEKKSAMAIIQAGLGMIRSGNPFEAIAAGAGQGMKSYGEAVDQAQATQQKLMESRLSMEAAVNAMKMGNIKDAVGLAQQSKKMDQEMFIANNHDAVQLTNNDKSVAAQIYDARLRAQTAGASTAVQSGLLALAAARNPAEIAKMNADVNWLNARAAAAPAKIDAATHAKAVQAATQTAQKSMYAYDPSSQGYKQAWQDAYDRAVSATPSAQTSIKNLTYDPANGGSLK